MNKPDELKDKEVVENPNIAFGMHIQQVRTLLRDIELNTMIQDRKYEEVLKRLADSAFHLQQASIPLTQMWTQYIEQVASGNYRAKQV